MVHLPFTRRKDVVPVPPAEPTVEIQDEVDEAESLDKLEELDAEDEQRYIAIRKDACDIMSMHLYQTFEKEKFIHPQAEFPAVTAIRIGKDNYSFYSSYEFEQAAEIALDKAVRELGAEVVVILNSSVANAVVRGLDSSADFEVELSDDNHVQVLANLDELGNARKFQKAAFLRESASLVIWDDDVQYIEARTQAMHQKLVAYVWSHASLAYQRKRMSARQTLASSDSSSNGNSPTTSPKQPQKHHKRPSWFQREKVAEESEKGELNEKTGEYGDANASEKNYQQRRPNSSICVYVGLGVAIDILLCGLFARRLVVETLMDGDYIRLAILAALPFMFAVAIFFCQNIVSIVAMMLMPIRQMRENSLYYSGEGPKRIRTNLPHMTIMIPVYKESLSQVILPTIESVTTAIEHYELLGGQANMIICDDGMQLISPEDRDERKDVYDRRNCGWAARPGHNVNGFIRKGRFKKSSNLNSTKMLSLRIEAIMDERRPENPVNWDQTDEDILYGQALKAALAEGPLWAEGNIRIGDYILLLDSDTRVPVDCLIDGASEMEQCPEVGILQHCNGTFLAGAGYFERGIAFFTRVVNFGISWSVSHGNLAPFMGHGAFLRWSALQQQSYIDRQDGLEKIWSEDHVSEDFVASLRLLKMGYITRWATYSNNQFLEGVSLSCDDEANRWKYAFGCSEILFNPFHQWFSRGPFGSIFLDFCFKSKCPTFYKFSVLSYIFSYWALASALPLASILYFIQGWYRDVTDPAWLKPFSIFVAVVVVFTAGGSVSSLVARYRARDTSFANGFLAHMLFIPFSLVFFGGLSSHCLYALLAHIFGYNMTWSATVKDLTKTTVFTELPKIFKRYRSTFAIVVPLAIALVVLALPFVPLGWRITQATIVFCPALVAALHILYPFLLNPAIMLFHF